MRNSSLRFSRTYDRPLRRRGISGILGAVILFAAIFAIGTGYFLFINNSVGQSNQANANNAESAIQASQEKLTLTADANLVGQALDVTVNNTGGVPVSIVDAYITCVSDCGPVYSSGQFLSSSTYPPTLGSHFLKTLPDLTVTLPLTLNIGSQGSIGISLLSCLFCTYLAHGEYVVASLLTSRGNVFSAQYPTPQVPQNNYVTVLNDSSSLNEVLVGGGPQLSVLLSATAICPAGSGEINCTQTFACNDGCITVTATIYNYASSAADGVSLSLHQPYSNFVSGTASVSLYSSCTPSTQDIPSNGQGTVTCQFSASTGHTGGLAAFSGSVTATISGVEVTSAEALSNSIEIGGLASVTTQGAFAADFFFLKYSSCFQDSTTLSSFSSPCTTNVTPWPPASITDLPSGSGLAGGSNYYVAFYVKLTNVFNSTLSIMQYSYTFGDPTISGEVYYFLAGSNTTMTNGVYYPNYPSSGTPTLTGYPTDCNSVNAQGRPTDSKCIYVNPGQTVTLTFAACGYGATNWAWGGQQDASNFDSSTGCTGNPPNLTVPEGVVMGIDISFEYNGNIYSQNMPFEAQAYYRSSLTSVSCSPSSVGAGVPSTCTATVADSDGNPPNCPGATLCPSGTVTFGGQAASEGTFSSNSCTLSSGSCTVTWTPSVTTLGAVSMSASYSGDDYHVASTGTTSVTVLRNTATSVTCSPASPPVNTGTTCTVTVTDTSLSPVTPTGTVSFTTTPSGKGSFSSTSCTLSGSGATASCTTTFTPFAGNEGAITVTGAYGGDSLHATSSGAAAVTAAKRTSSIAISCTPTSIPVTGTTTCTATVSDTSSGTQISPTGGTVTFSVSPTGDGAFSSTTCTTSAGTCSVTFTAGTGKSGASVTITASYGGDTDHLPSGPSGGNTITITKITTTTAVVCTPNPLVKNTATTCTATVSDSGGATEVPTGTVAFTANPSADGSFAATSCTLSAGACSVKFTPNTAASITITGAYTSGDADHAGSTGSTTLTVISSLRTTSTSVTCSPSPDPVNAPTTCTVTVTDTASGTVLTPTGQVTLAASPSTSGSFSGTCILSGSAGTATCQETYTPSPGKEGTITITATYPGDGTHSGSSGSTSVSAIQRSVTVTVSCSRSHGTWTCTATVTDSSAGTALTPTGTVTFSASPSGGSFSPTSCTLSGSGGTATCTATFSGSGGTNYTVTGTYNGDTDHLTGSGSTSFRD